MSIVQNINREWNRKTMIAQKMMIHVLVGIKLIIGQNCQDHFSDYEPHCTSIGCLSITKPDGNSNQSNSHLTKNEITYTEENINAEFSDCRKQKTKC